MKYYNQLDPSLQNLAVNKINSGHSGIAYLINHLGEVNPENRGTLIKAGAVVPDKGKYFISNIISRYAFDNRVITYNDTVEVSLILPDLTSENIYFIFIINRRLNIINKRLKMVDGRW